MEKPLTSVRRESMDLAGLLEEHGDHLLRLCTLYLGDRSQAEDAVQDTFLRALRAWPGFRGDCAVETWLVRIAINVCKRQLRSPWRLLRAPQESLDSLRMEGPEPPDDTLVRAIQALPPKYREVIILLLPGVEGLGDRPEAARSGLHRDGTALTGPWTAERTSEGVVL